MIPRKILRIFILLMALTPALPAQAAKVEYSPKGVLSFAESTPWGNMTVTFTYCLANKLFTFSTVNLDGERVNAGVWSDNIGPFNADGKWVGANHLDSKGNFTAKTVSVEITADMEVLDTERDYTVECKILTVSVRNLIGLTDAEPFAWERVTYTVAGNSIEVEVEHDYISSTPVTVVTYYGMQSMFESEKEILLPGAGFGSWIPVDRGDVNILKKDAPDLNLYIESNGNAMQASYLIKEDLGKHEYLADNHNIFTHSDLGKSYHSLMRYNTIEPGTYTRWHGVYSWFRTTVKDTFVSRDEEPSVVYGAYIGGGPCLVTAYDDGRITTAPYIRPVEREYNTNFHVLKPGMLITDVEPDLSVFDSVGRLIGT
ncbi:MAG: hypothetical protein K2K47_06150, partial [Duncaniella sp.]|nr:hypothetical protein [Duncaniella sp.]